MTIDKKAELLNQAALAIENTLADAQIQGLVAAYGYTPAKLNEARKLLEAALAASSAQLAAAGAQQQATAALEQAAQNARAAYQALAKVARAACDKPSLTMLGLSGRAPQSSGGLIKAAFNLFDNAPRVAVLAGFGYDAAKLAAGRAAIQALLAADTAQEAAKGAAQQATVRQKAAFKALETWLAQYIKIAKVALSADPQQLEKLGVLARSGKSAAQRAASRKQTPATA